MKPENRSRVRIRDAKTCERFNQARELEKQAAQVQREIFRLLGPLKRELRRLVGQRDRLLYQSLAARQQAFTTAKKAYPDLDDRRGLRYWVEEGELYVTWDESGPQFVLKRNAELAQLHPFARRRPGRRTWDVFFWPR